MGDYSIGVSEIKDSNVTGMVQRNQNNLLYGNCMTYNLKVDLDYFICKIIILVHKASLTKFQRIGVIQARISDHRAIEKLIRKLVTIPACLEILKHTVKYSQVQKS